MTITYSRKIKNKIRKSIIVFSITFAVLFSGFIPLIDLPEGNIREEPNVWFNPHLSDF